MCIWRGWGLLECGSLFIKYYFDAADDFPPALSCCPVLCTPATTKLIKAPDRPKPVFYKPAPSPQCQAGVANVTGRPTSFGTKGVFIKCQCNIS